MEWPDFDRQIAHLAPASREKVRKAFELGKDVHKDQKRKSGEPYFTHPIEVALMLARMGADEETLITALLHDTVEDTPVTIEEIGKMFGPSVQQMIDGLTKLTAQEFAEKPTLNEQVETLRKMFTLMRQDVRIMVIKLADRLHNMQTVRFLPEQRQVEMAMETADIYVRVASKLGMQDMRDELEGICLAITEPTTHQKLTELRAAARRESGGVIARLKEDVQEAVQGVRCEYEFQPWEKQRLLLTVRGSAITSLPRHTVALVCKTVEECYVLLGALHSRWPSEVLSFQDFINSPVMNGYRGVHTTIILEDGTRVRCKIRTEEMHAYAHRGITVYCFDGKEQDNLSYLPWMQRIAPLAEDTKDRSREFWDSLQNDILGQSILIYGTDNRSVSLPAGATALDAAFHLFQDAAVRVESLRINGQQVPLHHRVKHGDTLEAEIHHSDMVKREWLEWVSSSFATAQIRSALAGMQSEEEKIDAGKQMLQRVMHEGKKGYIEEFNERSLSASLASMGYGSLRDAYIAIADGHLDPLDAYIALFDTRRSPSERKESVTLTFFVDPTQTDLLEYLQTLQQNRDSFRELRYRYNPAMRGGNALVRAFLTPQEQNAVMSELKLRGATSVGIAIGRSSVRYAASAAVLLLLWALDPLFAKEILVLGMPPLLLSLIRTWTVAIFAAALFLFSTRARELARLPLRHASLWAAGVSFAVVSVLTYFALSETSPAVYNGVIRANGLLVLTPMLLRSRQTARFAAAWIATAVGFALLALEPGTIAGFVLSICTLVAFALYTFTGERFQKTTRVHARYTQFFFYISFIAAVVTLPLVFVMPPLSSVPLWLFGAAVAFSICFVALPYLIFSHLTYSVGYHGLSRAINVSLLITIVGQFLLFGTAGWLPLITAAALMIAGNVLATGIPKMGRSSKP